MLILFYCLGGIKYLEVTAERNVKLDNVPGMGCGFKVDFVLLCMMNLNIF